MHISNTFTWKSQLKYSKVYPKENWKLFLSKLQKLKMRLSDFPHLCHHFKDSNPEV